MIWVWYEWEWECKPRKRKRKGGAITELMDYAIAG